MSDHDDALLDEDFGDEEYDLGNDEEEALLADDNELIERLPEQQTIIKAEEETDDVLDLGVTEALDDFAAEEDNVQLKIKHEKPQSTVYRDRKRLEHVSKSEDSKKTLSLESQNRDAEKEREVSVVRSKVDLREKLREKATSQREIYSRSNQGNDDEDDEEAKERRNRFQSERITAPTKINHEIPDSLENVVTAEHPKSYYKGRDRSDRGEKGDQSDRNDRNDRNDRGERGDRRNTRGRSGGRYDMHQPPRYHHGHGPPSVTQPTPFRPPVVDSRPPFQPGPPNNVPMQHHMYPHPSSQVQSPYHHPMPNGPMGPPHFVEARPPMLPNKFPEPMRLPGPRMNGPRMEFGPRGPPLGPPGHPGIPNRAPGPPGHPPGLPGPMPGPSNSGPPFNCPPNQPPFGPNQGIFPNHGIHVGDRPHPGNQGPPMPIISGPNGSHIQGNQGPPISVNQGMPMQGFIRPQGPNQLVHFQNHPNAPAQPAYENRLPFPDPHYDGRPPFDSRNSFNPPVSQFNSNLPQGSVPIGQNAQQQVMISNAPGVQNMPNVPAIPTGHKILINPHFKGNQMKNDSKNLQDPADKFVQALRNASNTNSRDSRSGGQQAKSDDPFSYFSDVWQESKHKSEKTNTRRSYSPDTSYSKGNNYNYDSKYKFDNQWSHGHGRDGHSELRDHRSSRDKYREKEISPRPRNDQKSYASSPETYRSESHDYGTTKSGPQKFEKMKAVSPSKKESNRSIQKRLGDEITDKNLKENSPKRLRLNTKQLKSVEKPVEKEEKKEEETDPEMREYRRKMEEQKRLREKILREKENRRKLAAMEKQNLLTASLNNTDNVKQEPTLASIAKDNTKAKIVAVSRGRGRLVNVQSTEENAPVRVVRTVQVKPQPKEHLQEVVKELEDYPDEEDEDYEEEEDDDDDGGKSDLLSRIIAKKAEKAQKSLVKKNPSQSSKVTVIKANSNRQLGQIRQLLSNSQRIVIRDGKSNTSQKPVEEPKRSRIVMQKSTAALQEAKKMIKSNIVKIDNLAASTTEAQIRNMCQGIGSIESIQMGDGNAIIVFKTQSAAMVFHKKYQRKMLDLSLIKVQLLPQTTIAKPSVIHSKKSTKD